MKRLVTLMLILGLVSVSNADVQLTINNSASTSEITLPANGSCEVGITMNDTLNYRWAFVDYESGYDIGSKYSLTNVQLLPSAGNLCEFYDFGIAGTAQEYGMNIANSTGFSSPPGQVFNSTISGLGQSYTVTINLWNDAGDTIIDTATVSFVPEEPPKLTVDVQPQNVGINTVYPIGTNIFSPNTEVYLSAQTFVFCPATYRFDHWVGDVTDASAANTTVVMNTDKTVTAVFVLDSQCNDICHQEHPKGDLNGDCVVDFMDFAEIANNWLVSKGPDSDFIRIAYFSLDNNPNWITEGQWQFGMPTGSGGFEFGYPDPVTGYTGQNVYGVNLNGNYALAVGGPYRLTAGPFDCRGYQTVELGFARWLNTDANDYVKCLVEVSNDGSMWQKVWENPKEDFVADNQWQTVRYDISQAAAGNAQVYVRWSYQVLNSRAFPFSGWNIDDIELIGWSN